MNILEIPDNRLLDAGAAFSNMATIAAYRRRAAEDRLKGRDSAGQWEAEAAFVFENLPLWAKSIDLHSLCVR